ncbi:MAG: hypothetical protein ACE5GJ_08630 [Gemmatimonadota bacterium]
MSVDHDSSPQGSAPSGDGRSPSRLPPPAFPPGTRRIPVRTSRRTPPAELDGAFISPDEPLPERSGVPDDAFISPDEPVVRHEVGAGDDAFISPDEPIPHREPGPGVASESEEIDPDEVVVTGIGDDPRLSPEDLTAAVDPYLADLITKVSKLAEALKVRGEAGLRTTPEMDRFEATLRAYCVGYLAGRRAEDDPAPEF